MAEHRTLEELTKYIDDLRKKPSSYSQAADSMWMAAEAVFNYMASEVGATGFQGSWAALMFYAKVMHKEGPIMVIDLEDVLYPQYDIKAKVDHYIEENKDWIRDQALTKLAAHQKGSPAAPVVVEHWKSLVEKYKEI